MTKQAVVQFILCVHGEDVAAQSRPENFRRHCACAIGSVVYLHALFLRVYLNSARRLRVHVRGSLAAVPSFAQMPASFHVVNVAESNDDDLQASRGSICLMLGTVVSKVLLLLFLQITRHTWTLLC